VPFPWPSLHYDGSVLAQLLEAMMVQKMLVGDEDQFAILNIQETSWRKKALMLMLLLVE
jgi:hypothetical protein